jgi:hypothetical protein
MNGFDLKYLLRKLENDWIIAIGAKVKYRNSQYLSSHNQLLCEMPPEFSLHFTHIFILGYDIVENQKKEEFIH